VILRSAVLIYLVVLPVGHLVAVPVNGTLANGSDVFLALVLLVGVIELGRMSGPYFPGEWRRCRCFLDAAPSTWRLCSCVRREFRDRSCGSGMWSARGRCGRSGAVRRGRRRISGRLREEERGLGRVHDGCLFGTCVSRVNWGSPPPQRPTTVVGFGSIRRPVTYLEAPFLLDHLRLLHSHAGL
jgi:hypothetical protein